VRPIYAGNAISTVTTKDKIKLLTIRTTNFEKFASGNANEYPVEEYLVKLDGLQGQWVENVVSASEMADLSTAKFVISGGRGMKNGENFKILYELA
jgi:electron transfer flavoprotein alpha subunit